MAIFIQTYWKWNVLFVGYSGLSCESCSFGYVRIYPNMTNDIEHGYCGKCDCNGHSETCNPDTGKLLMKTDYYELISQIVKEQRIMLIVI